MYFFISTARNQQIRQLGLPYEQQDNMTFVQQFIADLNFDLLLLTEHYDEGLVLMKRKLCLNLMDILYVKLRENKGTVKYESENERKKRLRLEEESRERYKTWSKADYVLYNEANKTFWKEYSQHSDIQEETNYFKVVKTKVQNFCQENLFTYGVLTKDPKQLYGKLKHSADTLNIGKSRWNRQFKVDLLLCVLLQMDDNKHREVMRHVLFIILSTSIKSFFDKF